MAYFQPSIDADGIHVPAYEDILDYLISQYKTIFGDDVYLGVDSKDYQLLSVFARAVSDFASLAVDAYNSRSPLYATGDSLDVLCSIVGISRRPAEYAEADVTFSGFNATVIPAGSKVSDINGELWSVKADCTIGAGGTVTGKVVKDDPGMVSLVPGYISSVYTTIVGWDGVDNTTLGNVGKDTESDEELRTRMRLFLVAKGNTVGAAIDAAIRGIENVTHVNLIVNDSSETDERGIPSHSICAVVVGGDDAEIAQKIFDAKAPGIGTYGNESESILDSYGHEETIYFQRPTLIPFKPIISGTVYDNRVDLDALKAQIVDAIFEYGNSLDIGESCVISKMYPVIYSAIQANGVAITSISVQGVSGSEVEADWNQKLVITSKDQIDVSGIVMPE